MYLPEKHFPSFLDHEKKESCTQEYCTEGRLYVLGPFSLLPLFFSTGLLFEMHLWMSFLIIWNVYDRKIKEYGPGIQACHPDIKIHC